MQPEKISLVHLENNATYWEYPHLLYPLLFQKNLGRDLTVILNQSQFANDIKVADSSAL